MTFRPTHLVPLLDLTNTAGSFRAVKSAVASFVGALTTGDQFALAGYGEQSVQIFPEEPVMAKYSRRTVNAATRALRKLEPQPGPRAMGLAIIAGTELVQGSPRPLGMILIAEGSNDVEPDPMEVLPLGIPIYTIGLGADAPATLLQTIANCTSAEYFHAADASALPSILFDIIGRSDSGLVVLNGSRELSNGGRFSTVARVPAGGVLLRLNGSWVNPDVVYSANAAPGTITASILDPNFQPWTGEPVENDFGYVAFEIAGAAEGDWLIDWAYDGPGTVNLTVAAIVPEGAGGRK